MVVQFSLDVNNVVEAFIGKQLYGNDLTGIREAIQNSIDSCRYKCLLCEDIYEPMIEITIESDKISIDDNGLGMDDFIIRNFFSKLGKSFYNQEHVSSVYEGIGQFGVGIFSYFLLSEFVEVETKTEDGEAISFQFDKDPKSYFSFKKKVNRRDSGTKLVLNLKSDVGKKYSSSDFENYIKQVFRHIEIPIKLTTAETSYFLEEQDILVLPEEELDKRLKIQYNHLKHELSTVELEVRTDDINAHLIMIGPSLENKDELVSRELFEFFHNNSFSHGLSYRYSEIDVSQKGVFVTQTDANKFNFIIGKLNFLKTKPINISRNSFTDEASINNILTELAVELSFKMLTYLYYNLTNIDKSTVTQFFLEQYLRYNFTSVRSEDLFAKIKELTSDLFFVKVLDNKIETLSFGQVNEILVLEHSWPQHLSGRERLRRARLRVHLSVIPFFGR
jgi:molecular chaperone HtpG